MKKKLYAHSTFRLRTRPPPILKNAFLHNFICTVSVHMTYTIQYMTLGNYVACLHLQWKGVDPILPHQWHFQNFFTASLSAGKIFQVQTPLELSVSSLLKARFKKNKGLRDPEGRTGISFFLNVTFKLIQTIVNSLKYLF